jgi:hypothetical protein
MIFDQEDALHPIMLTVIPIAAQPQTLSAGVGARSAGAALLRVALVSASVWTRVPRCFAADAALGHPKDDQRAVIMRLHDFRQRLGADTLERPGDDVSIAIMREVRAAAPAIADAVEQRLGVAMTDRDGG